MSVSLFHRVIGHFMSIKIFPIRISVSTIVTSTNQPNVRIYDSNVAKRLGIEPSSGEENLEDGWILSQDENNVLYLHHGKKSKTKELLFRINFLSNSLLRRRRLIHEEKLVRAMGNCNTVLDFTAGLGRDSFLLACSNRHVLMFDRNFILYHLLSDGIRLLRSSDQELASKMHLFQENITLSSLSNIQFQLNFVTRSIKNEGERTDDSTSTSSNHNIAIYLDPMYPDDAIGRKALVKKESQILRLLCSDKTNGRDNDNSNNMILFSVARSLSPSRIVVKRPLRADFILPEAIPSQSLKGSTHRFDIYT